MKPYAILVATVLLTSGTPRVASAVTLPDALTAQAQESLAIANNTTIMAKLLTNVDATQAKVDDATLSQCWQRSSG
jgi:hypothetical protein